MHFIIRNPVHLPYYKACDVIDTEIKEMLELGVIEQSLYIHPSCPRTEKKTVWYGSVLISVNLKKVTEFDAEPMQKNETGHK